MAWIWSDELAAAAEAEGIDGPEVARWRRHLVAFPLEPGCGAREVVQLLLGVDTTTPAAGTTPSDSADGRDPGEPRCRCGDPEGAILVLGPTQTTV